jgi:hypothetical protein
LKLRKQPTRKRTNGVVTRTQIGRAQSGGASSGLGSGSGFPCPERFVSKDAERVAGCEMKGRVYISRCMTLARMLLDPPRRSGDRGEADISDRVLFDVAAKVVGGGGLQAKPATNDKGDGFRLEFPHVDARWSSVRPLVRVVAKMPQVNVSDLVDQGCEAGAVVQAISDPNEPSRLLRCPFLTFSASVAQASPAWLEPKAARPSARCSPARYVLYVRSPFPNQAHGARAR